MILHIIFSVVASETLEELIEDFSDRIELTRICRFDKTISPMCNLLPDLPTMRDSVILNRSPRRYKNIFSKNPYQSHTCDLKPCQKHTNEISVQVKIFSVWKTKNHIYFFENSRILFLHRNSFSLILACTKNFERLDSNKNWRSRYHLSNNRFWWLLWHLL